MMKKILTGLLVLVSLNLFAQKVKLPSPKEDWRPLTKAQQRLERSNHACVHRNKLIAAKRMKKFPFNIASHIQFVSFNYSKSNNEFTIRLPLDHDSVCYSKLKEVVDLNRSQIDSLTDVLYNVGFKGQTLFIQEISCYQPRNAILFKDSTNKLIAWIEICFHCQNTVLSSDKISLGDECDYKFDMIKRLFRNAGVFYGTGEEKERY